MPPPNSAAEFESIIGNGPHRRLDMAAIAALARSRDFWPGCQIVQTATGLAIITPDGRRIEITPHSIASYGGAASNAQMARMARLMFGDNASVSVQGTWLLRHACRKEGLIVTNNNASARMWRGITRAASHHQPRFG